jgi:hypothetical protein
LRGLVDDDWSVDGHAVSFGRVTLFNRRDCERIGSAVFAKGAGQLGKRVGREGMRLKNVVWGERVCWEGFSAVEAD